MKKHHLLGVILLCSGLFSCSSGVIQQDKPRRNDGYEQAEAHGFDKGIAAEGHALGIVASGNQNYDRKLCTK